MKYLISMNKLDDDLTERQFTEVKLELIAFLKNEEKTFFYDAERIQIDVTAVPESGDNFTTVSS